MDPNREQFIVSLLVIMLNMGTLLSPESSEVPPPLEDFAEEDQTADEDVDLDFLDEFAYLLVGYTVKKMQSMERGVLEIELNPERNGLVKALREKTDEFIKSDKEIHNVLWHSRAQIEALGYRHVTRPVVFGRLKRLWTRSHPNQHEILKNVSRAFALLEKASRARTQ